MRLKMSYNFQARALCKRNYIGGMRTKMYAKLDKVVGIADCKLAEKVIHSHSQRLRVNRG